MLNGPGVYVQEIPSGNHTITGVSTSVTVFVGRTRWGSVSTPTTITSYAEFTKAFGGPLADGYLASTVEDFFLNGGLQAIVIRLYKDPAAAGSTSPEGGATVLDATKQVWNTSAGARTSGWGHAVTGALTAPTLVTASPGSWGKKLTVELDWKNLLVVPAAAAAPAAGGQPAPAAAPKYQPLILQKYETDQWAADDLFNVTITLDAGDEQTIVERFTAVSLNPNAGSRQLSQILQHQSQLLRVATGAPAAAVGVDSAALQIAEYDLAVAALGKVETFNLICVPPDTALGDTDALTGASLEAYAHFAALAKERRAMLIVDTPPAWTAASFDRSTMTADHFTAELGITAGDDSARYAAAYFPWLVKADPLNGNAPRAVPPCGAAAGIMARTDQSRGVWKAPAGVGAGLGGILRLAYTLTEVETGNLNDIGVNCLRSFSTTGPVVWGSRTLKGSDALSDDFKYIPIRRLANYMEESLLRGTKWAVFEPNDEPLWAQIRLSVGAFMADLFRQGAFQGSSAKDAYSVTCDASVNSATDMAQGVLNVVVSYAPLKPAEFVILYFQQKTLGA